MGALHPGHLSLIEQAQQKCDVVICSIFVNPTQFNDPKDLEKYPRPIAHDIQLLESSHCDALFYPAVDEMYAPNEHWYLDLGQLDKILEAAHRPGHFQGVTQIVKKLFDIVKPDYAFFGQKDYQQYQVVSYMTKHFALPISIVGCPIVRESDGLAMSSRNVRLSEKGRQDALALYTALLQAKANLIQHTPEQITATVIQNFKNNETVSLEYFAICDTDTLAEVTTISPDKGYVALIAAWVDGVRLIDNLLF